MLIFLETYTLCWSKSNSDRVKVKDLTGNDMKWYEMTDFERCDWNEPFTGRRTPLHRSIISFAWAFHAGWDGVRTGNERKINGGWTEDDMRKILLKNIPDQDADAINPERYNTAGGCGMSRLQDWFNNLWSSTSLQVRYQEKGGDFPCFHLDRSGERSFVPGDKEHKQLFTLNII